MSDEKQLMIKPKSQAHGGYYQRGPAQPLDLDQIKREVGTATTDDTYSVQGKRGLPGAKIARLLAIKEGISTKIVEFGKNKEKAWCKVRAWKGPEDNPTIQTEDVVIHHFEHLLQQAVFDAISNGMSLPDGSRDDGGKLIKKKGVPDWEIGENGVPFLTNKWAQYELMVNHLQRVKFAERDASEKAMRNAIFDLISAENPQRQEPDKSKSGVQLQKGLEGKPEPKKQPQPQDGELNRIRQEIYSVLMAASGNDKEKAAGQFSNMARELNLPFALPSQIKTTEDANKILNRILMVDEPIMGSEELEDEGGQNLEVEFDEVGEND